VAVVSLVGPVGPESMVTLGGTVSTVQFHVTGADVFPAWSVAWTERTWFPSASPDDEAPDVHGWAAAPSHEHVTVAPDSVEKVKLAAVWFVGLAGPEVIVTAGGTVSTVQLHTIVSDRFRAGSTP